MPSNNSHSVIDKPELVNLVNPPTITIRKTNTNDIKSQLLNSSLIFFSFEIFINNIYLSNNSKILKCRYGQQKYT